MSEFPREIIPPPALEPKVVDALRSRHIIRDGRAWRGIGFAAAALLVFVAGFAAGRVNGADPPTTTASPEFMLLLHRSPSVTEQVAAGRDLVDEYRQWAIGVARNGNPIRGEKLKDIPEETLQGFFIVEAASLEAARAIADTCPHAQLGGRIEIREIDHDAS
jgi:hypothetical protein